MSEQCVEGSGRIVFFDLETAGKEPGRHPVIQFAAVAVDARTLADVEELEVKVQLYQRDEWEPEALAGNVFSSVTGYAGHKIDVTQHQSPTIEEIADEVEYRTCAKKWNEQAQPRAIALNRVDAFLQRHRSVTKTSKRSGKAYTVARLAGHNVAAFDIPHLRAWYGTRFMPAEYRCLDTYHLACWVQWMATGTADVQLNLPALRERFGIHGGAAHDALADVRATVELARRLLFKLTAFRMPDDGSYDSLVEGGSK